MKNSNETNVLNDFRITNFFFFFSYIKESWTEGRQTTSISSFTFISIPSLKQSFFHSTLLFSPYLTTGMWILFDQQYRNVELWITQLDIIVLLFCPLRHRTRLKFNFIIPQCRMWIKNLRQSRGRFYRVIMQWKKPRLFIFIVSRIRP